MAHAAATARIIYSTLAALILFATANAQVLVVNDNENITYNTDTLLNDLTAAGITYDVFDMPTTGTPPDGTLMDSYDMVIWYCSTDGVDLGFWDPVAQTNLTDRILAGRKTWIIGQDLLYANYGVAPVSFTTGEFPLDFMGIASYDVQSYGDDGNAGCPAMVVAHGVAGSFSAGFNWIFSTAWWVDGVTPAADATPIYAMGPVPYVLEGAISMLHFHAPGTSVMSTFFDPALIGTFADRVTFLQETLAYIDVVAGAAGNTLQRPGLRLSQNPASDRVVLSSPERIQEATLLDARGMVVLRQGPIGTERTANLDLQGLTSGSYIVVVSGATGRRLAAVLVKE